MGISFSGLIPEKLYYIPNIRGVSIHLIPYWLDSGFSLRKCLRPEIRLDDISMERAREEAQGLLSRGQIRTLFYRFVRQDVLVDDEGLPYVLKEEFNYAADLVEPYIGQRLLDLMAGGMDEEVIYFWGYVRVLSVFSPKANPETKLRLLFDIMDRDQAEVVTEEDLSYIIDVLTSGNLDAAHKRAIIVPLIQEGGTEVITFQQFQRAFKAENLQVSMSFRL